MYRPLFDQVLDGSPYVIIFQGSIDPLLVIDLPIDSSFVIMLSFLYEYIDFSELFGKQFPFKLGFDTKCDIEGETTTGRSWHPCDLVEHLVKFFVYSDCDKVLIDNIQLL